MSDWGDEDEELDLDALAAMERQAMAVRQVQQTADAAGPALPPAAALAQEQRQWPAPPPWYRPQRIGQVQQQATPLSSAAATRPPALPPWQQPQQQQPPTDPAPRPPAAPLPAYRSRPLPPPSVGQPAQPQAPQAQRPQQGQQQQPLPQRQQGAGPPRPPPAAAELIRRCHLFRRTPAPRPTPNHDKCPGVYGRGCGGNLRLVRWTEGSYFFACSAYPECHYREYPPPHKLTPELSITLDRKAQTVAVSPQLGAEAAVTACGGVAAVLAAAGVDLRRALGQPVVLPLPPMPGSVQVQAQQQAQQPDKAAAGQPGMGLTSGSMSSAADPSAAAAASEEKAAAAAAAAAVSEEKAAAAAAAAAAASGRIEPCASALAAAGSEGSREAAGVVDEPTEEGQSHGDSDQAQQPAAGQPPPDEPPAEQAHAAAAVALQPVVFPLAEYERLHVQLQQFGRQSGICLLTVQGMIPQPTLKSARGVVRALPSPDQAAALYAKMPPFLERALLPFQREGVRFGLARGGRCLIADEMGVGKTVQAIALASCFEDEWPLLVIVPASLRLVWAEELEKWLPHLRPSGIHVIEGKEDRVAQGSLPHVVITSYEMMQRLTCDACKGRGGQQASVCSGTRPPCRDTQNCMATQRWRVVIVDESHTLRTSNKPPDALHTEAVVAAVKAARRAILLTGTPSLSRPFDLFRQVDALVPGLLGANRTVFASAYCNRREVPRPGYHHGNGSGERRMRYDVSGLSRGAELHDMLKAEIMLRRLKRDVLSQLPPKRRQVIRLPKPPASEWPKLPRGAKRQKAAASKAEDSCSEVEEDGEEDGGESDGEGAERNADGTPKVMSSAHRTALAKASSVIEWLMTALGVRSGGRGGGKRQAQQGGDDDGEDGSGSSGTSASDAPKFLVFAHHKTVMNRLAAALEGATGYAPVGYVRIDGSTDSEDRRAAVRRFASDASVRVALLSVTAAGVGLDFSSASVVVFAELPDEVAHVRQAEDRAHRQGQRNPVNIYFLCAKGTTDDRRWQHLNRSLARVAAVHDGAGLAPAGAPAGCEARAAGGADADGGADAAGGGSGQQGAAAAAAVAAQAGLLVEQVYDADVAGLTQAAAKAGWAAGLAATPPGPAAGSWAAEGSPGGTPAAGTAAAAAADPAGAGAGPMPMEVEDEAVEHVLSGLVAAVEIGERGGNPGEPPCSAAAVQQAAEAGCGSPGTAGASPAVAGHGQPAGGTAAARSPAPASRDGSAGGAGEHASAPASQQAAEQAAAGLPAQATEPAEVWFEVSGNTGRIHFHGAPDGSAPLRLSLPIDALLAGDSPPLEELMDAVRLPGWEAPQQEEQQQQQQQQQHGAAAMDWDAPPDGNQHAAAAPHPQQQQPEPRRPAVVGGVGVLALDGHVTAARLATMLAEAREFAAEWRELRGLHQARLQGRVLRAPLDKAAEEVDRLAAASGKLGVSTNRFVDEQRSDLAVPPGAEWKPVRVAFKRYNRESTYQQPFLPDGARLCINCAKRVPGAAAAQPPEALLDGMTNLFCSGECEGRFALKSNGSAYRRALFKLERGICVSCRLDCHTLVKRLQAVEKGSRGWEEQRRRIIAARAPRLMARGYKAYLEALVRRAVEGNAWQADHILPVYKGGGLCDVDNLRTLCVACHADVTKAQAKERAAVRQQEKAARGGGGAGGVAGWGDVEIEYQAGGSEDGTEGRPVVRRRARAGKLYVEDSDDGSMGSSGDTDSSKGSKAAAKQQPAAAGAAAKRLVQRRRRLKPLMAESEDAEVEPTAENGPAAAAAGLASTMAAAKAATAGSRPLQRRQRRLVPLFGASEEGEADLGAEPGEAATAAEGQPAAAGGQQFAGQLNRLAQNSAAEEPCQAAAAGAGAAAAAAAAAAGGALPLTSFCANVLNAGTNKRALVANATKPADTSTLEAAQPARRPKGRVLLDNDDWL